LPIFIPDNTYRKALENWKDFVDLLCPKIVECDWTIPQLPAKDLVYRLQFSQLFNYLKSSLLTLSKKEGWFLMVVSFFFE
jgi:hypothetical protein